MTKKTTPNVARSQRSRWQRNSIRKTAEAVEATALGISIFELRDQKWEEVRRIIGPQVQSRPHVIMPPSNPPPAQERRPQREPWRWMFP